MAKALIGKNAAVAYRGIFGHFCSLDNGLFTLVLFESLDVLI